MAKQNNNIIYWIIGIVILSVILLPKLDIELFAFGDSKICAAVCVPMYEIDGDECVFDTCGSGCGADGINTFKTLEGCEEALVTGEECLFTINEFCVKLWMLLVGLGAISLIIISTRK